MKKESNKNSSELVYKAITISLMALLLIGYISWLKGYQNHIDTCTPDHVNQTCTIS